MRRACVFCGSSAGTDPAWREAAGAFGRELAARRIALVYGGGSVGLMGALADGALAAGGEVIGVIPRALWDLELGHRGVRDMRVVPSMHERKALMAGLSDAFVALPGGLGTLEELFETWTWGQLGLHAKPLALLDVGGFWDPLVALADHLAASGFVAPAHRGLLLVARDAGELLDRLAAARPAAGRRWLTDRET